MQDFLIFSLIGSIVLTVLLNLLPLLFPKTTRKAEQRIVEKMGETIERSERAERGEGPRVKVFFPWKWMLLASVVLTVLVNVVGWFAGR